MLQLHGGNGVLKLAIVMQISNVPMALPECNFDSRVGLVLKQVENNKNKHGKSASGMAFGCDLSIRKKSEMSCSILQRLTCHVRFGGEQLHWWQDQSRDLLNDLQEKLAQKAAGGVFHSARVRSNFATYIPQMGFYKKGVYHGVCPECSKGKP